MRPLSRLTNGIRALFRRGIADEELDAELQAFLETAVDEKMRSGIGREEATRAARLEVWVTYFDVPPGSSVRLDAADPGNCSL